MSVWILKRLWHFQGDEIVKVYESEDKAKAAKDVVEKIGDTTVSYEEWEVE